MSRIAKAPQTDITALIAQIDALKAQITGATPAVIAPKPKAKVAMPKIVSVERGVIVGSKGDESPCMVFIDERGRETRIGLRKICMVVDAIAKCTAMATELR
jgi:hypothetical protein